ncbi:hypothetical protein DLREEDagrD3_28120 [Denitratisoma sp. agr-D3]
MTGLSRAFLRTFLAWLALLTALPAARAALPDPVAFGVAMEVGDLDKARQWLDEGLPPNFLADRIGTGLMIAAWEGNIPLMELFVQRGANVNFVNRNGEQAVQLAAWKGQTEAVKWLLSKGAALNRRGKEWSALHYAVFAGHEELSKYLIERGANINGQAPNGSTVLMMAAREGHEKIAQTLVEAGADTSIRNDAGESALTWAMRHNNLKIAKMVATPEAFALAVKSPPQSFGVAIRSVPPPQRIAEILRQINRAEATGQPTAELRKALYEAVAEFKRDNMPTRTTMPQPNVINPRMPKQPQALVITAERQRPGAERAEMVYAGTRAGSPASGSAATGAMSKDPAELLRQLKAAEAAGKPTTELRRAFFDAVKNYRGD